MECHHQQSDIQINGATLVLHLENGTYDYSIGAVSNYTITHSSGAVTIDGTNSNISTVYNNNNSSLVSSITDYIIVGGVVAVVAALVVGITLARRKK